MYMECITSKKLLHSFMYGYKDENLEGPAVSFKCTLLLQNICSSYTHQPYSHGG